MFFRFGNYCYICSVNLKNCRVWTRLDREIGDDVPGIGERKGMTTLGTGVLKLAGECTPLRFKKKEK
jgi:hypothetical protein